MVNYIKRVKDMLKKNEKILAKVIVQRSGLIKNVSTYIFLTDKRIIYWKCGWGGKGFKSINFSEITAISFIPRLLETKGLMRITKNNGKVINITPMDVNQIQASDFIKEVNKKLI